MGAALLRLNDILDTVSAYAPDADLDLLMRAYVIAAKAHAGQMRKSGEPYLVHPLGVAGILASMRMDVDTIATALLHDTIEDCLTSPDELQELFGPVIAELVQGVTKIGKLQFQSKAEAQAENFRKMVLAMAQDVRVVIVKLADRLHNMRTLEHMTPAAQRRIAQETEEIYAPIANRLGLHRLKEELQNLCLRFIHPRIHADLEAAVAASAEQRDAYIQRTTAHLTQCLKEAGITCDIQGRAKSLASVHRKMVQQKLEFEQIHDLLAFRLLADDISACYEVLGTLHGLYKPVPDKIKDYIAMPKVNGYQSLHTTVLGPEAQRIELQIRTREMHQVAERGIAAHWRYKEGHLDLDQTSIQRIARLRELFETAWEVEDSNEFLATVKIDLFTSEVYVFTPALEVKVFPAGATVLDFAYAIHTDLGNTCVGGRVGGRMVPMRHELASGDIVEINTRKDQKPSRDWLNIARTGRALAKIRRALRNAERDQGLELGRNMLSSELKRHGRNLNKLIKDGTVKKFLKENDFRDLDQALLALARGHLPLVRTVKALVPEVEPAPQPQEDTGFAGILRRIRGRARSPVLINGVDDVLVSYARCCNPLPGEQVTGFITRGRGITVHMASCPQLLALEPERRIPVQWDPNVRLAHSGEVRIVCADRPGLLANITACCDSADINITRVEAFPIGDGKSSCNLEIAVHSVKQLNKLMRKLEKIRGVMSVGRVRK